MILHKNIVTGEVFSTSELRKKFISDAKKLWNSDVSSSFDQFVSDYQKEQKTNYIRYNLKPMLK